MSTRQRQHSAPSNPSTAVTLHFKERNAQKQPLYRPAALRRNGSVSVDFIRPSPPNSPSLAAAEPKSSWLSSFAPWSPSIVEGKEGSSGFVRGRMLPRAQWKPDETAEQCADPDCSQRFDLLNRRHHCRTCGDIFCAAHSSRSTLLWPSAEENGAEPALGFTPRGTPRATPRSSSIDLPSLAAAYSISPASSCISTATGVSISSSGSAGSASTASTSTPTSSPPQPSSMPCSARVCDRCYFSAPTLTGAPTPLLTPPILPSHVPWAFGAAASSRPVTLRHPRGGSTSRSRSRASSPNSRGPHSTSPPSGLRSASGARSRQDSAASLSSSSAAGSASASSEYSTPSTSVEGLPSTASASVKLARARGLSPSSTSVRLPYPSAVSAVSAAAVQEEGESDTEVESDLEDRGAESDEDEERHEQTIRERRRYQQEFGSVQGGPWQSWATF
ncbi:hypothetical protein JCM10213_002979 [Rhodosporidiobolus nylandii]